MTINWKSPTAIAVAVATFGALYFIFAFAARLAFGAADSIAPSVSATGKGLLKLPS